MPAPALPTCGVFWLVDKPAGVTSHDVVATIRRSLPRGTKVGHAGTLDPFATGLLVVAGGRATRLLRYLVGLGKTYEARVALGARSASGDPEGPIVRTGRPAARELLPSALAGLTGEVEQRVPALSAVRVDGERLYARTRRGETPALPTRRVTVEELRVLDAHPDLEWLDVRVRCSSGTYIRQIACDLGDALGSGGYCERLRRTAVGSLELSAAVALDDVTVERAITPLTALAHLPRIELDADARALVTHGRPLPGAAGEGPVLLVADGRLVAVAVEGEGGLRSEVVLG